jgi:hypothetical protein
MGKTIYPEPFASLVKGRTKRKLGEFFGLTNFGVNLTHLAPGAISALSIAAFCLVAIAWLGKPVLMKLLGLGNLS